MTITEPTIRMIWFNTKEAHPTILGGSEYRDALALVSVIPADWPPELLVSEEAYRITRWANQKGNFYGGPNRGGKKGRTWPAAIKVAPTFPWKDRLKPSKVHAYGDCKDGFLVTFETGPHLCESIMPFSRRVPISTEYRQLLITVIMMIGKGKCPNCQMHMFNKHGDFIGHIDHYDDDSSNSALDNLWPVCAGCNLGFNNRRVKKKSYRFEEFHQETIPEFRKISGDLTA